MGVLNMVSSNNSISLSNEELSLALDKINKELSLAKEKLAVAKREVAEARKEAAAAKEEAAKQKARGDKWSNRYQSLVNYIKERGDIMKKTVHGLKDVYGFFDKITYENVKRQLNKIFNELTQCIINAHSWRDQIFASGNDLSKSKTEITSDNKEEGKEENKETDNDNKNEDKNDDKNGTKQTDEEKEHLKNIKGLVTCVNAAENLKKKMDAVIKSSNQGDIHLFSTEICHIAETNEKETEKTKKTSPGRQRVDRQTEKTLHPDKTSDKICSSCGVEMENMADIRQKAICLTHELSKWCANFELYTDFYVCPKCGHVHGVFPENADLPVQPDREFSISTLLYCIDAISNGYPLNRIAADIQKRLGVGHSTVQENVYVFVEIYLVPLAHLFYEWEKRNKHLMLDGTPFRCLESQKLGNCMNKNPDRKRSHNQGDPVPVEEGKSNYLLCCCSVPGAEEQFITYHFLPTRTYDAIANVITPDHSCDAIISDAFQAYDKLAKERKYILQKCFVHFRRYVIKAADLNNFAKDLLKMDEQKQTAFLKEMLQKGTPHMLLCCVFLAISKIYSYESSYDRTQPDYLDKILETRQKIVLPLMDDIDKIMEYFVDKHTDPSTKGEGRRERRGDPYSQVAVYWYNNHDKLRSFLEDPMIPPDTNIVEQNIRTATIIRKNSYFMTSQRGINALCTILTVIKSLYRNGVENPTVALLDYCRALYSYCFDKAYTKAYLDNNTIGKKLTSWNMIELSKGFDFGKQFSQILNKQ